MEIPQTGPKGGAAAPSIEPISVGVEDGCRLIGISRAEMYREMQRPGTPVRSFKMGQRRLIFYDSLKALADQLARQQSEAA